MSDAENSAKPPPEEPCAAEEPLILHAHQLFLGKREIWIEHAGERYRLRITRRNKLILQK
jgi:hemin uptake protein HemP